MSTTDDAYCCTCAINLSSIPPTYDEKTEKPARHERLLPCCSRVICSRCITDNPRFESYCPFCQVSSAPGPLPQGLRDPPAYEPPGQDTVLMRRRGEEELPGYEEVVNGGRGHGHGEKGGQERQDEDVLHFVHPDDTVTSISLRYGVPADALRRTNGLFADHLLAARKTVLVPGEFYKGESLSPQPIEGEEEELRKSKVRRFMVACKVVEYDVATLYLKQADYDLEAAVVAFKEDERWEKEHPLAGSSKGSTKGTKSARNYGVGGGLSRQI